MQNMDFYYDFSGQKFGYPLSLSINSFSRSVFSRQSSLEISYVLSGKYEAVTRSFTETMKKGDMIVIAPYEIHMLRKTEEEGEKSIILTLHIDFSRMSDSMAGDSRNAFSTALCTNERNRESYLALKRKLGSLLALLMEEKDDIYRMNVLMNEMLSIASKKRNFSMEELPLNTDQHHNYMKAIGFIDSHYSEDITLESIADCLSFSLSYTSKMMKKYTGLPFVKYLSYVRVRASLESLLEGRDSIEKISEDVGMPSAKAYSSSFRELYGIAPSLYRKMFQKNLRYSGTAPTKRMAMDAEQKKLIADLVNSAEEEVYEDDTLSIRKKDGNIHIKLSDGGFALERDADGNIIINMEGRK